MPLFYSVANCSSTIRETFKSPTCSVNFAKSLSGAGTVTNIVGRTYRVALWTPELEATKRATWCLRNNLCRAFLIASVILIITTVVLMSLPHSAALALTLTIAKWTIVSTVLATIISSSFATSANDQFAEQEALNAQRIWTEGSEEYDHLITKTLLHLHPEKVAPLLLQTPFSVEEIANKCRTFFAQTRRDQSERAQQIFAKIFLGISDAHTKDFVAQALAEGASKASTSGASDV